MQSRTREKLKPLVKEKSIIFGLEYSLVDAIIQVESGYDIYAVRFEKSSIYKVIPEKFARMNRITTDTEIALQKFSWGLCQIMGSTARWLGFQGPIPLLCEPTANLTWSLRYLSSLQKQYGTLENVIAAYNAGSVRHSADGKLVNQEYVTKVISMMI